MAPNKQRYNEPRNLRAANAKAELVIKIESPALESDAWIYSPLQIPRVVITPERGPRARELLTTSIVSAPGVMVNNATNPEKYNVCKSSI